MAATDQKRREMFGSRYILDIKQKAYQEKRGEKEYRKYINEGMGRSNKDY